MSRAPLRLWFGFPREGKTREGGARVRRQTHTGAKVATREETVLQPDRDVMLLERVADVSAALRSEVEKRIIGQHHVIDGLLTALLANGHALLVGVPGLAKTLLVSTQAALLQAMQERAVTTAGETYDLTPPFFVLATRNPIEQEGTYPLPEASSIASC